MDILLKIMRSKCAGNHGALGAKTYKLLWCCFHLQHGKITTLGLKIERKNTNQCFRGLEMED